MPPSSKTWSRQDGLASKRKRPSAHDFFDDSKKRARPEADRAVSRDCSPKTARDQGSGVREKTGSVSFSPYPEGQDLQDSRQHSPLFVSSTNECHHDNQTKPFATRDYPLSPLSHSPEHIPDGSREPTKNGKLVCPESCSSGVSSLVSLIFIQTTLTTPTVGRQTLYGSFFTGEVAQSPRMSTSETERGKYNSLGKPFTRHYVIQQVRLLTRPRAFHGSIHCYCS